MTAFNSFFLQFKNDAAKSKKDVAELEKQIDSLRAKGKKRSEEETSSMKDAIKRHKELAQNTKETEQGFERLAGSVASAAAAFAGFSAIKAGIFSTAELNRNLAIQTKNLSLNTQEVRAYGAAFEKAGDQQGEFASFVSAKSAQYASIGQKFDLKSYLKNLQSQVNLYSGEQNKRDALAREGITGQGMVAKFLAGDAEMSDAEMQEFAKSTGKADEAAVKYGESTVKLNKAWESFWSTVGGMVLPAMTETKNVTADFLSMVASSKMGSGGVFAIMLASATALLLRVGLIGRAVGGIIGMTGAGGAAVAGAAGVGGAAVLAGGSALAADAGLDYLSSGAVQGIGNLFGFGRANKAAGVYDRASARAYEKRKKEGTGGAAIASGDTGGDGMSILMGLGRTREESAAILANIKHESGFNPAARGDGGAAHGLAQHHPDRRAKILKATGIDMSTAGFADQLKAIDWEMKNEGIFSDQKFKSLEGAGAKAAYFSSHYERPANAQGEAFARAQTAMNMMGESAASGMAQPAGNSRSMSVKIDKVEVNTQATDADAMAAGASSALTREISFAAGNFDDGIGG